MSKPFNYGGQAVIEGVMMRGGTHMAVAVREPEGEVIKSIVSQIAAEYPGLPATGEPAEVTDRFTQSETALFQDFIDHGGKLRAVLIPQGARSDKLDVAAIEQLVFDVGAKAFATIGLGVDGGTYFYSDDRLDDETAASIASSTGAKAGDFILLIADKPRIIVHQQPINSALYNGPLSRIPFVRGLGLLWDSLGLGIRALNFSADVAMGQEADFSGPVAWTTMAISLVLGIALFLLLPVAAAGGLQALTGFQSDLVANLVEGLIRLVIVIGYIWLIGRIPDVKRLFAYHGAEHKASNAYEDGAALTPESVARYPLEHPRCGTGFLLVVVVVSILVFALVGKQNLLIRFASRIVLLPIVAGIAYEYIRLLARNLHQPIARVLVKPQLALQRLTTREPSLDMLEVSLTALKRGLEAEHLPEPSVQTDPALVILP